MASTISAGTTAGTAVAITGDTTGNLALLTQNGANTITVPNGTGTMAVNGVSSNIVAGTAVASTSGTSIDFTSIPSWVKRITVNFNNVSLSGTTNYLIQIGNTTPTTSGYTSIGSFVTNGVGYGASTSNNGFVIQAGNASYLTFGSLIITNISGNIWTANGVLGNLTTTPFTLNSSGIISLGSALNMIRITTVNGTDTFDAGTINILYE